MLRKILSLAVIICFSLTTLSPLPSAHADSSLNLPVPGAMINLSPAYEPVIIKGLTVHKDNPFLFDFIVDVGQDKLSGVPLKKEGEKLIKYFLASLAIPDKDVWVNLSPYENTRIIPEALGQTDMGRDLLEQDYVLKQITASLIYPEKKLGKIFWDTVYAKAQQMYGTTQIPVNTFNKVWILADRAKIYEHNQTAFVVDSHMKVMLEEDYLALEKNQRQPGDMALAVSSSTLPSELASKAKATQVNNFTHNLASQIVRSIVLPELEKEVNTGKNFANLRQILNSLILANWYKKNLKQALLNQVYSNRAQVKGINLNDPMVKQQIYEQYLQAYKKGVFSYIKEETNAQGVSIPRKYFSGGIVEGPQFASPSITDNASMLTEALGDRAMMDFKTDMDLNVPNNAAMVTQAQVIKILFADEPEDKETIAQVEELLKHIREANPGVEIQIISKKGMGINPADLEAVIAAEHPAIVFVRSDTKAFGKKIKDFDYKKFVSNAAKNGVEAIVRMGVGYDNIDEIYAATQGMSVIRTHGSAESVAELNLFLIAALAQMKDFPITSEVSTEATWGTVAQTKPAEYEAKTSEALTPKFKKWPDAITKDQREAIVKGILKRISSLGDPTTYLAQVLSGKTIAILGFGAIGRELVMRLHAFKILTGIEFNVIVAAREFDKNDPGYVPEYAAMPETFGFRVVERPEIFKEADILSVQVPGGIEAIKVKDAELVGSKIKAVINTAREDAIEHGAVEGFVTRGGYFLTDIDPSGPSVNLMLNHSDRVLTFLHYGATTKLAAAGVGKNTLLYLHEIINRMLGHAPDVLLDNVNKFPILPMDPHKLLYELVYNSKNHSDAELLVMISRLSKSGAEQGQLISGMRMTILNPKVSVEVRKAAALLLGNIGDKEDAFLMNRLAKGNVIGFTHLIREDAPRFFTTTEESSLGVVLAEQARKILNRINGEIFDGASQAVIDTLHRLYREAAANRTDENIKPIIIKDASGQPIGVMFPNDVVFLMNHRTDRILPILEALTNHYFNQDGMRFDVVPSEDLTVVPLVDYDRTLLEARGLKAAFPSDAPVEKTISDLMVQHEVIQGRFAESNKEKHVTYFWDGRRLWKTDRYAKQNITVSIVPSEGVSDELKKPEMKYKEVADNAIDFLEKNKSSDKVFALVNFATDIQGHVLNGDMDRARKTVLATDEALGRLREKVKELDGTLLVTADHGNIEEMFVLDDKGDFVTDEFGKIPSTQHSRSNPVPFIVEGLDDVQFNGEERTLTPGKDMGLANVGSTVLDILGIEPAPGMAPGLLKNFKRRGKGPVVLVVRDGWGLDKFKTPDSIAGDAVAQAKPPVDTEMMENDHWISLKAHGDAVGLPESQMGDSDNGHTTMGAARIVPTQFSNIMHQIQTGEIFKNEVWRHNIQKAMDEGKDITLLGLLSAGGVHSHYDYFAAFLRLAAQMGIQNSKSVIKVLPELDGRDVMTRIADQNGAYYLSELFKLAKELGLEGHFVIGPTDGRAWGMDRDGINGEKSGGTLESKRIWQERFQPAYDAKFGRTDAAMAENANHEFKMPIATWREIPGRIRTVREAVQNALSQARVELNRFQGGYEIQVSYFPQWAPERRSITIKDINSQDRVELKILNGQLGDLKAVVSFVGYERPSAAMTAAPEKRWTPVEIQQILSYHAASGGYNNGHKLITLEGPLGEFTIEANYLGTKGIRGKVGKKRQREEKTELVLKELGGTIIHSKTVNGNAAKNSNVGFIILSLSEDFAMSNPLAAQAKSPADGGIDLNTSNGMQWDISKSGLGVEMNVNAAMLAQIKEHGIGSLSPVVLRVTLVDPWALAGVQAP